MGDLWLMVTRSVTKGVPPGRPMAALGPGSPMSTADLISQEHESRWHTWKGTSKEPPTSLRPTRPRCKKWCLGIGSMLIKMTGTLKRKCSLDASLFPYVSNQLPLRKV